MTTHVDKTLYLRQILHHASTLKFLLDFPHPHQTGASHAASHTPQISGDLGELYYHTQILLNMVRFENYGPNDPQRTVSPATSPTMRRYSTSQLAVVPKLLTNNNNKRLGTLKTWFRYQYGTDPSDRLNNRALLNMLTNLKRNSEKNTQSQLATNSQSQPAPRRVSKRRRR